MALPKLKILCLHGKQQNKEIFRTKLGRIPHKLRNLAELTIIDAPLILESESTPDSISRTWFYREPDTNCVEISSLLETITMLEKLWQESGPFDGVLGFSMGGTIASLIAGSANRTYNVRQNVEDNKGVSATSDDRSDSNNSCCSFPGLQFVICAGAVDIHPQLESSIVELNLPLLYPFKIPTHVTSLHIAGTADTSVPIASSIALSQRYTDARFIEHDQGHHIPMKALVVGGIVAFVAEQQNRLYRSST